MKVIIDAGHGPETPGKRCPDDSMREYHFNSVVARYVAQNLANYENVQTKFTHEDGRDVPINERYKAANAWGADVFVSIHANAWGGDWNSAGGIETLVDYRKPAWSVKLAQEIQKQLVHTTGLTDRGLQYRDDLGVLNFTKMTAILVECGFMTNRNEANLLKSDDYRRKCARAIVQGLALVYGLQAKGGADPVADQEKKTNYLDVPAGHWAEGAIAAVQAAGIMSGRADGMFGLGEVVTREELAAALNNFLYVMNNK